MTWQNSWESTGANFMTFLWLSCSVWMRAFWPGIFIVGYGLFHLTDRDKGGNRWLDLVSWPEGSSWLLYLCLTFLLVLKILTKSFSSDMIDAMSVFLLSDHLIFFNCGANVALVSSKLPSDVAIFALVCLASHLPWPLCAFIMGIFAVQIFAHSLAHITGELKAYAPHSYMEFHFFPILSFGGLLPISAGGAGLSPSCFLFPISVFSTSIACSLLRKKFMGPGIKLKSKTCPGSSANLETSIKLWRPAARLASCWYKR